MSGSQVHSGFQRYVPTKQPAESSTILLPRAQPPCSLFMTIHICWSDWWSEHPCCDSRLYPLWLTMLIFSPVGERSNRDGFGLHLAVQRKFSKLLKTSETSCILAPSSLHGKDTSWWLFSGHPQSHLLPTLCSLCPPFLGET